MKLYYKSFTFIPKKDINNYNIKLSLIFNIIYIKIIIFYIFINSIKIFIIYIT